MICNFWSEHNTQESESSTVKSFKKKKKHLQRPCRKLDCFAYILDHHESTAVGLQSRSPGASPCLFVHPV